MIVYFWESSLELRLAILPCCTDVAAVIDSDFFFAALNFENELRGFIFYGELLILLISFNSFMTEAVII